MKLYFFFNPTIPETPWVETSSQAPSYVGPKLRPTHLLADGGEV